MASLAPALPRPTLRVSPLTLITAMLVGVAVWQQVAMGLDCDVSWLLTVGERVLDGQRLYVDVVEVNPPASVLLYLPAIALARMLDVTPELVTCAMMFALVAGSTWTTLGLLPEVRRGPAVAVTAFVLLALPAGCFAQREHVALVAALPALAALALRAEGRRVAVGRAVLAGIAGGVTIAIKPHFVLAFLVPLAVVAWRRRSSLGVLGPESACAALVAVAYAGVVLLCFPVFMTDIAPMLAATYLPLRLDWATLLTGPVVAPVAAMVLLGVVVSARRPGPLALVLFAAALGFALAGVIQGKGYLNHAYPGIALGLFGLCAVVAQPGIARRERAIGTIAALLLAGFEWHAFAGIGAPPGLAEAVARVAPPHPRVIALSSDLGLGHPITRRLGGEWVGRPAALYIGGGVRYRLSRPGLAPATARRLLRYEARDAAGFARDVARGRPDVVLEDGTLGSSWIAAHPPVVRAMAGFQRRVQAGGVTIWTRR